MFPTALPKQRADRWGLLDEALLRWFVLPPDDSWGTPASHLDDAEHRLGLRLPPGLREWFERYGALARVWSLQDRLHAPTELQVRSEALVFCTENQGGVEWGIRVSDLALEDPTIVVSSPTGGGGWFVETDTTSTFALLFAAMNAKWSDRVSYRANGQLTDEAVAAVERNFARLPFGEQHWPSLPTRLYGDCDLVVESQADTWLWVASLSQARLAEVDAVVTSAGMTWQEIEDGTPM
jgi:hypothetical protein